MTATVITCAPGDKVSDVASTMVARNIRHVPVVEENQLVGMISIRDVLNFRVDDLQQQTACCAPSQVTRGVSRRIGSSRFELAEGSAEDLLLAALKAKTEHPEATIMYVRPQNRRGDARHPPLARAKGTR